MSTRSEVQAVVDYRVEVRKYRPSAVCVRQRHGLMPMYTIVEAESDSPMSAAHYRRANAWRDAYERLRGSDFWIEKK
jgi:hypothetical protein